MGVPQVIGHAQGVPQTVVVNMGWGTVSLCCHVSEVDVVSVCASEVASEFVTAYQRLCHRSRHHIRGCVGVCHCVSEVVSVCVRGCVTVSEVVASALMSQERVPRKN